MGKKHGTETSYANSTVPAINTKPRAEELYDVIREIESTQSAIHMLELKPRILALLKTEGDQ